MKISGKYNKLWHCDRDNRINSRDDEGKQQPTYHPPTTTKPSAAKLSASIAGILTIKFLSKEYMPTATVNVDPDLEYSSSDDMSSSSILI